MKKVAFFTNKLTRGGQERVTANIASYLSDQDKQIYLVTFPKEEGEYDINEKISRKCYLNGYFLNDIIKTVSFLNEEKIDIAISIGFYTNLILAACSMLNRKYITVISERNDPQNDMLSLKSKILRLLLYRFSTGYVFQTEGAKSFYSRNIQNRSWIIPNPVTNGLPLRAENTKKRIVTVGRLSEQKDQKMLIDAMMIVTKSFPEYKLIIYGKGNLEKNLKSYVKANNLSEIVSFEGEQTDVHQKMIEDDIFVLSSRFEGMPNTLMEAMAMGFPSISTDCPCGGPAELIENEKNGILVPVGDSESLAKAIIMLINNPSIKEKIGKNAVCIRDNYSIEKIADKWNELIYSLS